MKVSTCSLNTQDMLTNTKFQDMMTNTKFLDMLTNTKATELSDKIELLRASL